MSEEKNATKAQPETQADDTQVSAENAALKAELEKAKNDFLYLRADFDNYKKNVIKERSELLKYGGERVFVELLEVLDNFDRALALEVNPDNIASFQSGVKMIAGELRQVLTKFHVTELPAQGVAFDPNIHEALGTQPTTSVPSGHIAQVLKKPYKLHDKVIRHGQVIIAAEPKSDNNDTTKESKS